MTTLYNGSALASPQDYQYVLQTSLEYLESVVQDDFVQDVIALQQKPKYQPVTEGTETVGMRLYRLLIASLDCVSLGAYPNPNERYYYACLALLAKSYSAVFIDTVVIYKLCNMLYPHHPAPKKRQQAGLLAANILFYLYRAESTWPQDIAKAYVSDSLYQERAWVDSPLCAYFVKNILPVFSDSVGVKTEDGTYQNGELEPGVHLRFHSPYAIYDIHQHLLNELNTATVPNRTAADPNTMYLIIDTCKLRFVRVIAARSLDYWLQHVTQAKKAQYAFVEVARNVRGGSAEDNEVVYLIVSSKIRTNYTGISMYMEALGDIVRNNSAIFAPMLLRHFLYMEVVNPQQARTQNALRMAVHVFRSIPRDYSETASRILALMFYELALTDQNVRLLVRRVVRTIAETPSPAPGTTAVVPSTLNMVTFCEHLMMRYEFILSYPLEIRDKWVYALTESVFTTMLVLAPLQRTDAQYSEQGFRFQVARVQAAAVAWYTNIVPVYCTLPANTFVYRLYSLLFLHPIQSYFPAKDGVADSEKNQCQYWLSELPVEDVTIHEIVASAIPPRKFIEQDIALNIIKLLVRRAAQLNLHLYKIGMPCSVICIANQTGEQNLIQILYYLVMYHPNLPQDVKHPTIALAQRSLFWDCALLVVELGALCPQIFAARLWELYTTRYLIEKMVKLQLDKIEQDKEREDILYMQKEAILQFGLEMVDLNAYFNLGQSMFSSLDMAEEWYSRFMINNIDRAIRIPPPEVVQQLRYMDEELKLASQYRACREPDLFQQILYIEGIIYSLPWLSNVLYADINLIHMLQPRVLCELLLMLVQRQQETTGEYPTQREEPLIARIAARLSEIVTSTDVANAVEVLNAFLLYMRDKKVLVRSSAKDALERIMQQNAAYDASMEDDNEAEAIVSVQQYMWLQKIRKLHCFEYLRYAGYLFAAFRECLMLESDTSFVAGVLQFLAGAQLVSAIEIVEVLHDMFKNRTYLMRALFYSTHGEVIGVLLQRVLVTSLQEWDIFRTRPMDQATLYRLMIAPVFVGEMQAYIPLKILDVLAMLLGSSCFSSTTAALLPEFKAAVIDQFLPNEYISIVEINGNKTPLISQEIIMQMCKARHQVLQERAIKHAYPLTLFKLLTSFGLAREAIGLILSRISSLSGSSLEDSKSALLQLQQVDAGAFSYLATSSHIAHFPEPLRGILESNTKKYSMDWSETVQNAFSSELEKHRRSALTANAYSIGQPASRDRSSEIVKAAKSMNHNVLELALSYVVNTKDAVFPYCSEAILSPAAVSRAAIVAKSVLENNTQDYSHALMLLNMIPQGHELYPRLVTHIASDKQSRPILAEAASSHNPYPSASRFAEVQSIASRYNSHDLSVPLLERVFELNEAVATKKEDADGDIEMNGSGASILTALVEAGSSVAPDLLNIEWQSHQERESFIENFTCSLAGKNRGYRFGLLMDTIYKEFPSLDIPLLREVAAFGLRSDIDAEDDMNSGRQLRPFSEFIRSIIFEHCSPYAVESFAKLLSYDADRVGDPLAALAFLTAYLRYFTSSNTSGSRYPDLIYHDDDPIMVSGYVQFLVASAARHSPLDVAGWFFEAENTKYIDMLVKLIRYNHVNLDAAVKALVVMASASSDSEGANKATTEAAQSALVWLYANEPALVSKAAERHHSFYIRKIEGFTEVDPAVSTKFDPVLHRLGQLMSQGSPDSSGESFSFSSICKYLALHHPYIVIRYIDSLCACLEDCSNMTSDDFLERGLLWPYLRCVAVLYNLRPEILSCGASLVTILRRFFRFAEIVHSHNINFVGLLAKFFDFLCACLFEEPPYYQDITARDVALDLLLYYRDTLAKLKQLFPEIRSINAILKAMDHHRRLGQHIQLDGHTQGGRGLTKHLLADIKQNLLAVTYVQEAVVESANLTDFDLVNMRRELDSVLLASKSKHASLSALQTERLHSVMKTLHQGAIAVPTVALPFVTSLLLVCETKFEEFDEYEIKDIAYQLLLNICVYPTSPKRAGSPPSIDPLAAVSLITRHLVENLLQHRELSVRSHALRHAAAFYPYCDEQLRTCMLHQLFYADSTPQQHIGLEYLRHIITKCVNI